jgi:hypothetical protein
MSKNKKLTDDEKWRQF